MDIWCANGSSYYDGGEIAPKVVSGSSRLYLLLVSTTTFLGPLFSLASISSGWFMDKQVIPKTFNPYDLAAIAAIPSPEGPDKLPYGYNEVYLGPHFITLASDVYALVAIAYVLSLLANATFPMKMLGPWRIRTSCFPMFIYLFQGIFILTALVIFHMFKLPDIPSSRIVFSTSYYSAVISCTLSFVSALFLGIDFIVLSRLFQNRKGVGCSPTMMVLASCLVIPSLWCHFGAFVYHLIEKWPPILGFYFSLATITTIGFGDFRAESHQGRTFLFFHTLIGIILMVGLATSVKSAFKNVFRSGRAERIRRKSLSVQANHNIDQAKNGFGSRQFALDLGTLRTHFLIAGLNFLLLW
ncbi:Potassium channel, variant 2 [Entomophthora muscae]|nr:Potassium channel, variant 2 [Entomophthora muscae]